MKIFSAIIKIETHFSKQMIPIVSYIKEHPSSAKRLIGLSAQQLEQLINKAREYQRAKKEAIAKTETRLIKPGGGRKSILNPEEQIILTLY